MNTTSHNIIACCWGFLTNTVVPVYMGLKSLTGFKLYATSANIVVVPCKRTQQVGPNNVACCWPKMLRPFPWPINEGKTINYVHALNMCLFKSCSLINKTDIHKQHLVFHVTEPEG